MVVISEGGTMSSLMSASSGFAMLYPDKGISLGAKEHWKPLDILTMHLQLEDLSRYIRQVMLERRQETREGI
jgi:hypothetical protein